MLSAKLAPEKKPYVVLSGVVGDFVWYSLFIVGIIFGHVLFRLIFLSRRRRFWTTILS